MTIALPSLEAMAVSDCRLGIVREADRSTLQVQHACLGRIVCWCPALPWAERRHTHIHAHRDIGMT